MRKIIDWWGLTPLIKNFTQAENTLPVALTSMPPVPRLVDVKGLILESGMKLDSFSLHSIMCGLVDLFRNLSDDPIGFTRASDAKKLESMREKLERAAGVVVRTIAPHLPKAAWLGEKQNAKISSMELNWSVFDRYAEAYRRVEEAQKQRDPEKYARKKALHRKIDEKNRILAGNRGEIPEKWFGVLLAYHLVAELVRDEKQTDLLMLALTSHQTSCFKPFFPEDVLAGI